MLLGISTFFSFSSALRHFNFLFFSRHLGGLHDGFVPMHETSWNLVGHKCFNLKLNVNNKLVVEHRKLFTHIWLKGRCNVESSKSLCNFI